MKKARVAIIGTGNIGTDLLMKVQRSDILSCGMFTGRNSESPGLVRARNLGIPVSSESVKAIQDNPDCCDIVFDATSAETHILHATILRRLGKFVVDLTPSRVGKMCVPEINLEECLDVDNVNLITCGGQATIPLLHAIVTVHPETEYVEVVASISSRSAGPGTRANIDEFTQTTRTAVSLFTGVKKAKVIIILNPAEPPVLMHNTIYAKIRTPRLESIRTAVAGMAERIRRYVPGYQITLGPVVENDRVTTMVEVIGRGDFLPKYSGNLDIITCAAVKVAEEYATRKIMGSRA